MATIKDIAKKAGVSPSKEIHGIFAVNDAIAIGAIKALGEKGLQIPKSIGIIGFDDTRMVLRLQK
jgi:DNA-binding LacI/PurR family transcriptional regulator